MTGTSNSSATQRPSWLRVERGGGRESAAFRHLLELLTRAPNLPHVLPPSRRGNGHERNPNNLAAAERGTRWRCRQCGSRARRCLAAPTESSGLSQCVV